MREEERGRIGHTTTRKRVRKEEGGEGEEEEQRVGCERIERRW